MNPVNKKYPSEPSQPQHRSNNMPIPEYEITKVNNGKHCYFCRCQKLKICRDSRTRTIEIPREERGRLATPREKLVTRKCRQS